MRGVKSPTTELTSAWNKSLQTCDQCVSVFLLRRSDGHWERRERTGRLGGKGRGVERAKHWLAIFCQQRGASPQRQHKGLVIAPTAATALPSHAAHTSALVSATDCREPEVPKTKKEKEREKNFLEAPAGRLPSVTSYKQGLVNLRTLGRYRGLAPVVPNKQNDCLKCEDLDAGVKQGKHGHASISSTEYRTGSRWSQGQAWPANWLPVKISN